MIRHVPEGSRTGEREVAFPDFEENEVLFGSDPTPGIVAVEPVGASSMRLFRRDGLRLSWEDVPFSPFILLEDERHLAGFPGDHDVEALSGENPYACLASFRGWPECLRARDHLRKTTGDSPSAPQASYLFLSDPVHQFLLRSGRTLFKGLPYPHLHRLAIDIETGCTPGFEFSNAGRPGDRILSMALADSQGHEEVLFAGDLGESEMLQALCERIRVLDPDVIEGHNLFNFDLAYILARARMHRIPLRWGRDGSEPRVRRSRFTVAERIIDFTRVDLFGRHVVDTLFLLQAYDVAARELESYGLKSAAVHFGLSADDRTVIDGGQVQWTFENDPETLRKYNLDDARETLALSELLGYSFFLQARIFPYGYQNIPLRGNATKINALFLREYLRRGVSIPRPQGGGDFEGGYTDVFVQGLVRHVVHCDVASLYPSIMITFGLKPRGDTLSIFLPLLEALRVFRLEAKKLAQGAPPGHDRDYYQALQQTFKVLINSFYGYLGTELHHFADPTMAAEVTRKGREIIRGMLEWLRENGAVPIELDTDGIYFVPPPGIMDARGAAELVARLSDRLPDGIEVEMTGVYRAMFSYKRKNYALMDEAGSVTIKGSGLRSRGMEKYLRDFLAQMIRLLLEGRGSEVDGLFRDILQRLERGEVPIQNLVKTESLTESPESYREKVAGRKRNRAAAYELALASGREYRAGDQVSYYVTGQGKRVKVFENCKLLSSHDPRKPDANAAYYQAKLLDLYKKFQEFIPSP
jgi:DNA polymerase elongation subunit (family B)